MFPRMERLFVLLGALSAFISVAAGAFGAHALKPRIGEHLLSIWETGARYQMYHALGLVLVGFLAGARGDSRVLGAAGWLFVAGTLLFSGSLYALSVSGVRVLGAITPLGGLSFLAGWIALVVWAVQKGAR